MNTPNAPFLAPSQPLDGTEMDITPSLQFRGRSWPLQLQFNKSEDCFVYVTKIIRNAEDDINKTKKWSTETNRTWHGGFLKWITCGKPKMPPNYSTFYPKHFLKYLDPWWLAFQVGEKTQRNTWFRSPLAAIWWPHQLTPPRWHQVFGTSGNWDSKNMDISIEE